MIETVLTLLADYGVPILATITFLSCLAVPIPSSLAMLTAGGFAATGDFSLAAVALGAFVGAVLGDNLGYWIARWAGEPLANWLQSSPSRASLYDRASQFMERRGGPSVFLSCWLVAPLGPTMNYVSGITHFPWLRFALWGFAGEVVWVSIYVGLGYSFAESIDTLASLMGNLSGLILALVVLVGLLIFLVRAARARPDVA